MSGLRQVANPNPVRVITVTSGKGGVGKTNISVNMSVALAASGQNVLLMDADLGLANVDVLLGLQPAYNLSHVVNGERSLEEVIVTGPEGVRVIPASSGLKNMAELSHVEHAGLIRAFSELSFNPDVLVIDTAAGVSDSVVTFSRASHEVIVVVCDEPASITDAYATIKLLSRDHGLYRFRIVANMVRSSQEGVELYKKLVKVTNRFLDATLDYMGAVPYDDYLRKAIQKQRSVVDAYPRSKASIAFKKLAQKTDQWPTPDSASGYLEFFVERLFKSTNDGTMTTYE
ncbi:Flagellar synthesis regulator FleN [hydrothermal vent metagenome]|uniref:Flagellar synthesis regulator FleN n=1 Tax=hydrothermal vent metagenome TaxID=652676 RepID=A0A3B0ZI20_9ZZZZ